MTLINNCLNNNLNSDFVINDCLYSKLDLKNKVSQRVTILKKLNVTKEFVLLIPSNQGLDFFVDMLACWIIGITAVPIDKNIDDDTLHFYLQSLGAENYDHANGLEKTIYFKNKKLENMSIVLFTSGSTGLPKGIIHSLENILGNARATIKRIGITKNDRIFINTPFNFTSSICHFLAAFLSGASFVAVENKLFPADLFKALKNSKANIFGGAPIQLLWLSEIEKITELSIKFFMTSGDDLPQKTVGNILTLLPDTYVVSAYGLSEIAGRGCITLFTSSGDTTFKGVGKPIEGLTVSIYDENFNLLKANESGQVYFSGDYLLTGLLTTQELNINVDRGYATGDIGYLSTNNVLFLEGRNDDVFKVSGKKVSSLKIRAAMLETGFFDDCAVIPINDELLGNLPAAIFVLKELEGFNKGILIRSLRHLLPNNHIPKQFYMVSSIVRTGSGKLIRNKLLEQLEQAKRL
jgi:acyl-coenzyme A synthetase/AMP-(fatty) acid ligase